MRRKIWISQLFIMMIFLTGLASHSGAAMQLTSPNGGETWYKGRTYTITWTDSRDRVIDIELKKGSNPSTIIARGISSISGRYSWLIPSDIEAGTDYRVRIIQPSNTAHKDKSDNDFNIAEAAASESPPSSPSALPRLQVPKKAIPMKQPGIGQPIPMPKKAVPGQAPGLNDASSIDNSVKPNLLQNPRVKIKSTSGPYSTGLRRSLYKGKWYVLRYEIENQENFPVEIKLQRAWPQPFTWEQTLNAGEVKSVEGDIGILPLDSNGNFSSRIDMYAKNSLQREFVKVDSQLWVVPVADPEIIAISKNASDRIVPGSRIRLTFKVKNNGRAPAIVRPAIGSNELSHLNLGSNRLTSIGREIHIAGGATVDVPATIQLPYNFNESNLSLRGHIVESRGGDLSLDDSLSAMDVQYPSDRPIADLGIHGARINGGLLGDTLNFLVFIDNFGTETWGYVGTLNIEIGCGTPETGVDLTCGRTGRARGIRKTTNLPMGLSPGRDRTISISIEAVRHLYAGGDITVIETEKWYTAEFSIESKWDQIVENNRYQVVFRFDQNKHLSTRDMRSIMPGPYPVRVETR